MLPYVRSLGLPKNSQQMNMCSKPVGQVQLPHTTDASFKDRHSSTMRAAASSHRADYCLSVCMCWCAGGVRRGHGKAKADLSVPLKLGTSGRVLQA